MAEKNNYMTKDKWTHKDLWEHIRTNVDGYGSMVVVAMLYKKLYGKFPKIGMSGTQAGFADSVLDKLPEPNTNERIYKLTGIK